MKKLLASIAFALSTLAFQALSAQPLPNNAPAQTVALKFYEALGAKDPAKFKDVLAENWKVYGTSPSLPTLDFDGYLKSLGPFVAGIQNTHYKIESVHVAGDIVTVRGTITGTHAGPFLGLTATGKKVEFGAIDIHRVATGRIVESWHIEDLATLIHQLGGMPYQR
jgi:predicted ester cyclase